MTMQSERLGQLIDELDNLAHGLQIPLAPKIHVKNLSVILPELVNKFKGSFVEITGENPWK